MNIIIKLSKEEVKGIKLYLQIQEDIEKPSKENIEYFINECINSDLHFGGIGECVKKFENKPK